MDTFKIEGKDFEQVRDLREDLIAKLKEANRLTAEAHKALWGKIAEIVPETKGRHDIDLDHSQEKNGVYIVKERELSPLEKAIANTAETLGENNG